MGVVLKENVAGNDGIGSSPGAHSGIPKAATRNKGRATFSERGKSSQSHVGKIVPLSSARGAAQGRRNVWDQRQTQAQNRKIEANSSYSDTPKLCVF